MVRTGPHALVHKERCHPSTSPAATRCPSDKPRARLADRLGLYLAVTPICGRYFRQKYRHASKEKRLGPGVADANSFEAVARAWHEQWKAARTDHHADHVQRRLEADLFPVIGAAEYLNQVLADGKREELLLAMRYLATAFGGVSGVGRVLAFAVDPLVLTEPAAVAARALTCDASPSTAKPLRATQQVRR